MVRYEINSNKKGKHAQRNYTLRVKPRKNDEEGEHGDEDEVAGENKVKVRDKNEFGVRDENEFGRGGATEVPS